MESWGLGPKELSSDLIYTRISGYGQTGPKAKEPGYASVCEAYGGFRYLNAYPDRPPVRPNMSLGDSLAGLHAALGTVMALLHMHRCASVALWWKWTEWSKGGCSRAVNALPPQTVLMSS
eukprot:GHRR01033880.1.p1 GENE.GHRR01033880.1~~GHRR01033880.1.p1  ORF type:complete len:120 (-),score=23.03 GHRR01033880.1:11-370(-)